VLPGSVLVGSGGNRLSGLPRGEDGDVLYMRGGRPEWVSFASLLGVAIEVASAQRHERGKKGSHVSFAHAAEGMPDK
jgi:hypothetical protein